jgi:hypothetical protein
VPALDGTDDAVGVGGPDERFGVGVLLGEDAVDRRMEIDQRVEHASLEPAPGEFGEEALDGVERRTGRRREIEGEARLCRSSQTRTLGCLGAAYSGE